MKLTRALLIAASILACCMGPVRAQQLPQPFNLLNNAGASGPIVSPVGGSYLFSLSGTFGGTSVAFVEVSPSGQSFTLATHTSAITAPECYTVPASYTVQAVVTGGAPSALFSTMGGVGTGSCPSGSSAPVPISGTVTANQGTAASVAAGWPVINGEPADATGTFTNATQTGNVTTAGIDGYGTALVTVTGTYGTATAAFLASDDNGTTFYPIACARTDGTTGWETGYTSLSNVSRAWLCPVQGFDSIRVLSSAVASGTVNVRISQTSAPTSAAVSQPTSPGARTYVTLDIKTVTTGGTAVNALSAGHHTAGGFLQNPRGATIDLCINEIGVATGTTSSGDTTCVPPGGSYNLASGSGAVSVITSDSAHPFSGYGLN